MKGTKGCRTVGYNFPMYRMFHLIPLSWRSRKPDRRRMKLICMWYSLTFHVALVHFLYMGRGAFVAGADGVTPRSTDWASTFKEWMYPKTRMASGLFRMLNCTSPYCMVIGSRGKREQPPTSQYVLSIARGHASNMSFAFLHRERCVLR